MTSVFLWILGEQLGELYIVTGLGIMSVFDARAFFIMKEGSITLPSSAVHGGLSSSRESASLRLLSFLSSARLISCCFSILVSNAFSLFEEFRRSGSGGI